MTPRRWHFALCIVVLIVSATVLFLLFFHPHNNIPNAIKYIVKHANRDNDRLAAVYTHAAVSVDAAQCSSIGADVMTRLQGTAVDAAVAVLFCMGLVIPESMGIGGGSFFTIFEKSSGKVVTINGRETAPSYAHVGMFGSEKSRSAIGVDAIAVPGELAAYYEAHQRFGRLPFHHLMQPTIDLARKGFEVGSHLANAIRSKDALFQKHQAVDVMTLMRHPVTQKYYAEGDIMQREDLADALEIIQREGRDALYSANGTIARKLIHDLKKQGSRLTLHDLANYTAKVEEAAERVLPNGMNFYSVGLPASGPVLGFMLDTVMRTFDTSKKLEEQDIDAFYRNAIEAFKFAFGQRSFLGDPEFERHVNCSSYESTDAAIERLQSTRFSAEVAERITEMRATHPDPAFYQQPLGHPLTKPFIRFTEDEGTAALTVVDAEGNAVSAGSSINSYFGSFVVSPSTGLILNNQMDDFSANWTNEYGVYPSQHNQIAAGKRPLSSISPTLITSGSGKDQQVVLAIGASGGTQITTSQALVILRTLLFDDVSLEDAVREPRVHHQLQPDVVQFENEPDATFSRKRRESLEAFGHVLQPIKGRGSIVMAIKRDPDGDLEAVTDWRKGGSVDGFR